MRNQQLIAIIAVTAILTISGLFVVLPSKANQQQTLFSISTTQIDNETSNVAFPPTPRNIEDFGNLTTLANLPSSAMIPSVSNNLIQVREKPDFIALIYNGTGSFIPGYDQNFSLLVVEMKDGTNYTYPFNRTPSFIQEECSYNNATTVTTLEISNCTTVTQYNGIKPNLQVSNFTMPDGAKGWAYQNDLEYWDNGIHFQIISAGMNVSATLQIAESMQPVSSTAK